jgi:outer membrane protein
MKTLVLILLAAPVWAQNTAGDRLSLREAVQLALRGNRSIAAAVAGVEAAQSRVSQARAGYLPRVNYSETVSRGNNPVYVFGSLLTQHQFTESNFVLGTLNRPDALNNFASLVTADQTLYDGGQTRRATLAAGLARQMSTEEERRARLDVAAGVAQAYYSALLTAEAVETAGASLRSAEADLERATSIRDVGMATDADVLSIRVHVAAVTEAQIQARSGLTVARAALNDALGLPLDTPHELTSQLTPWKPAAGAAAGFERQAVLARPELLAAHLAASLAENQLNSARSALLPQVGFHGAFEADRQRPVTRGGANWTAAVSLRWNLYNGGADKARIAEASHLLARARAAEAGADSSVRLEVRRAAAALDAATERIAVAQAGVTQAEESLRITQNRYGAGMSNVTDLLRTETALLESRTRYLAAVHDQRVAALSLERAAGSLSADSEVLN